MKFLICDCCNKNIDIEKISIIEWDIDAGFYRSNVITGVEDIKNFIRSCANINNEPEPVFEMKKYHSVYDNRFRYNTLCGPLREPNYQEEYLQWIEENAKRK